MRIIILLFVHVLLLNAFEIQNGRTLFLRLENVNSDTPVVFMEKEYLPLKVDNAVGLYILPIDYKTPFKSYEISYKDNQKNLHVDSLVIKDGEYKKESLKVDSKKVTPPKELEERIYKEYKEATKIYETRNPKLFALNAFIYPMDSKITSDFGNARVFNNELKSYHSGTDFRAGVGTPLKAVNDGVVVLVGDRYYAGGSVVIDHGKGIYSCYFHLSEYLVKVGDSVKKGDVIAKSGKSGRVTGPHLHFGFKVAGKSVDPLDFIKKYNELVNSN